MSKLIRSITKAKLTSTYTDYASSTSSIYYSIAFTTDGYLYTHGLFYRIFPDASSIFTSTTSGNIATLYDNNSTSLGVINVGVTSVTSSTTDAITASVASGTATLAHVTNLSSGYGTSTHYGTSATSNTSGYVPYFTVDTYGHITSISNVSVTFNDVLTSVGSGSTAEYITFGASASATQSLYTSSVLTYIPSTGQLNTSILNASGKVYENGSTLESQYAPILHSSTATTYGVGTSSNYGHVKVSDTYIGSSSGSSGVAATPYAVLQAYNAAAALFTSNDAMVFIGTISGTGVIQTHNTAVLTQSITNGTTNISGLTAYTAGWTFKVSSAGTITGIGTVDVGDMVICVSTYSSAYATTDWTVIQNNIVNAVTTGGSTTLSTGIPYFSSTNVLSALSFGSSGSVLKSNGTGLVWGQDLYRPISVSGTAELASTDTTALNFAVSGTGLSINYASGTITLTSTGLVSSSIYNLDIYLGATKEYSYDPVSAENSIEFLAGTNMNIGFTAATGGANNIFTFNATDTWRAIGFSSVSSGTLTTGQSYGSTTNTELNFGSDFAMSSNNIEIVWEEIASDGTITYV